MIVVDNLKKSPGSVTTFPADSKPTEIPYPCTKAKITVPYLVYWVIFLLPGSPSFLRAAKCDETLVINCMIIEDEIYGIIPSAKIAILLIAPPANTSNIPKIPLWFVSTKSFN